MIQVDGEAESYFQEEPNCETVIREMMPVSFHRVEVAIIHFHDMARSISPVRTLLYVPPTFLSYISRQNQANPVSTEDDSDDEGPPDLVGDSDEDSDSTYSCNSTIAAMLSLSGSIDSLSDSDSFDD
jgi:hypothetical protein